MVDVLKKLNKKERKQKEKEMKAKEEANPPAGGGEKPLDAAKLSNK